MTDQVRQEPWKAGVRELNACLPTLPQQEFLRALKTICGVRDINTRLPIVDQVKLALFEWLKHLGDVLGDDQRRRLLEKLDCEANPSISAFAGSMLARHDTRGFAAAYGSEPRLETYVLALHDYRYATWPGQTAFWDIEFEEAVEKLPQEAATIVVCNLTVVYCRVWERLQELRSRTDAGHQSPRAADLPAATPPAQGPTSGATRSGNAPGRGNLRDHVATVVHGQVGQRKRR